MVRLERLSVLVSDAVMKALDKNRGDIPRSRYVARFLEEKLGISPKERVKDVI